MTEIIKPNAIILDTNVLVHDPNSIEHFIKDNTIFLPTAVLIELDGLKRKIDIGGDAREAIHKIEQLAYDKHPSLVIMKEPSFTGIGHLSPTINDHKIIATAYQLQMSNSDKFRKVKMISKDAMVRILTRELNIIAQDYFRDRIDTDVITHELTEINVPYELIETHKKHFSFPVPDGCIVPQNGGIICLSDWNGIGEVPYQNQEWQKSFTAIRKGNNFKIIPRDISMFGLTPQTIDGSINWEQYIAIAQLMDPSIQLVFLQGSTGSGKTLLALASALEQRRHYRQILITRPMIHLEDEDRMGFLPGDINEKMSPWLRPIWKTLNELGSNKDNSDMINKLKETNKIDIEPLDFIRGMTFFKDFLIIDESQNLTPHQIKTIITRSGKDSKIVFTGDLGQIDRKRRLDKHSSGLAYASSKMFNQKLVANSVFKHTVRSELADLAEKLL